MTNTERTRSANLRRLLKPASIAVVGASADPAKAGSQALRSLAGFPGKLWAVHPRESAIQGVACYPSLAALPEPVDLAVLAIPAERCVQAAREAAASGVGGIFIISGGFGESGAEGAQLQAEMATLCRDSGLRLLGPNTSGFVNTHDTCVASFVPGIDRLPKGRIAVIAQSGGVNLTLGLLLHRLGEGVSIAVGLGNAVDVDSADVLDLLADDPNTRAIALHLEGVPQGRRLFETLARVTPKKPVVALVAGRADIGEFAVSHTGNLMGSHQRTVSALTQAGAVVVNSTEELAQAAAVLGACRLPPKARNALALVTGQAGPGLLIVDALKSADVDVPELGAATINTIASLLPPMTYMKNPVDTGRPGPGFAKVIEAVARDPLIDAVLVFGLCEPAVLDPAPMVQPAMAATGKPVVFGTLGLPEDVQPQLDALRQAGVPAVLSPERLALAGQVLVEDARARWRLSQAGEAANRPAAAPLLGSFDEDRAKALLSDYGITSPARRLCLSREAALDAFRVMHKPVVVKIAADDVPHKTDAGGVFLHVGDEAAFVRALDAIAKIPTATPGRVLVEEMAGPGLELIIGGVRDASWGPCLVIGLGGVLAEALADSAVRLAPLSPLDVHDMLDSLRGRRLLEGFRHLPVCNRETLIEVTLAIQRLLLEHPEVQEIEINPLRVTDRGVVALDALISLVPVGQ